MQQLFTEKIETNKGYAEIKVGVTQLVSKYHIILHKINPEQIKHMLEHYRNSTNDIKDNHYKKLINVEIDNTESMLHTLLPIRQKRSLINAGGRLLNWAFGTLDDQDKDAIDKHFENLENNNNEIIENLNRQVEINDNFNKTFQQIEHIIKNDRELVLQQLNGIGHFKDALMDETRAILKLFTINSLKQGVQSIQQNIIAARSGTFHPGILSKEEITKYDINFRKLRNIKIGTAFYRQKTIVLAIKIPTKFVDANKIIRVPIPNNDYEQINMVPETEIQLNNKSYKYTDENSVSELKASTSCVLIGKCQLIKNKSDKIIELDDNMVIAVNQNGSKLNSSCDQRHLTLKGHYLITYSNCSIQIDNVMFKNTVISFEQKFILPNEDKQLEVQKVLSFEDIVLKQKENIKKIKELHVHKMIVTTSSAFSVTAIFIIAVIGICIYCKQTKKDNPELPQRNSISIRSLIRKYPVAQTEACKENALDGDKKIRKGVKIPNKYKETRIFTESARKKIKILQPMPLSEIN